VTTLEVNGTAQFGSGATKSTFTATGFWIPRTLTLAQMRATTPAAGSYPGGFISVSDAAVPYSLCYSTGATVQGFTLYGAAAGTECK
jgi:hypothetical protein